MYLDRRSLFSCLMASALLGPQAYAANHEGALQKAIDGAWRSSENKARDAHRHPAQSLTFWGLKPGASILEISPGAKGWWTEILAPYAKLTSGSYTAAMGKPDDPAFLAHVADKTIYGDVKTIGFSAKNHTGLPANSFDFVLVARAFHSWAMQEGVTDNFMGAFFAALKKGGVLAVEQHRAIDGADPKAGSGYVPESYVIDAAKKAGFVLDGRSEINANPKDTRDHPFGVWTLPPVRSSKNATRTLSPEERARFDAIGESDRMTLRFKKPA